MQKLQFNIISRDDWAQLANKQFGYFYFVVDDVTVLDAGGDLYLGENLIGSGMTIEDIVEYFENPENEHTFPGVTAGDLVPRGETAIEISERFGIHGMGEKRYIKSGDAKLKSISGITVDENNPTTVLKCGLNTGEYQNWQPSYCGWLNVNEMNVAYSDMVSSNSNYYLIFQCVKGVPGKYGNPDLGQNNGYVVTGGEEIFVGYKSGTEYINDISYYQEMTGVRLEGQPQTDTHVYYMPADIGWMCIGYDTEPVITQTVDSDGTLNFTITVNGTEVGCHLAMDNKMDDVSGSVTVKTFYVNADFPGIAPSEIGPGASDEIIFTSSGNTVYQRISTISAADIVWDTAGDPTYDETTGTYKWIIQGYIDGMKPDGAFAITGGYENAYLGSYANGNQICIVSEGSDLNPWDWPNDIGCSIYYEVAEPQVYTDVIQTRAIGDSVVATDSIKVSKYGHIYDTSTNIDIIPEQQNGIYAKIEYQQSGGDQIWNAIAYQKEMAEVTAAALCDLDSRIDNLDVDFTPLQNQIDALSEQIEDIPQWIEYPDDEENPDYLTFTAEQAGSTISLNKVGTVSGINNMEYSTNGGFDWTTYTFGTTLTFTNVGDTIMFRGDNRSGSSTNTTNYLNFSMTGKIAASGSSTSLYNKTGELRRNPGMIYVNLFKDCTALTKAPKVCSTVAGTYRLYGMFQGCTSLIEPPAIIGDSVGQHTCEQMFYGCTSLIQAPELPALYVYDYAYKGMFQGCTSLKIGPSVLPSTLNGRNSYGSSYTSTNCYYEMFSGCTSLIKAPDLPSKNTANNCYYQMFNGCTSLKVAPELPATTLAQSCYFFMFQDCTSLTKAPSILPATTLANSCYYGMFRNCTSLTKAPELPAKTLVQQCYQNMFFGCTSLTKAPELPAVRLSYNCYQNMFQDCTSLTEAPELPATTLVQYCYQSMFSGCHSLTQAPELPATTLVQYCYQSMFSGCHSLTQAPELPATTLAHGCYYGMFYNCTSLTKAPDLPATTLASICYYRMFCGCTSLVNTPELPAKTLEQYCYQYMFQNCSNLNYIKALFMTTPSDTYTKNWVSGVAATGTFVKNVSATWTTTGVNAVPTGWTTEIEDRTLKFTAEEASTIKLVKNGNAPQISLYYSINDSEWAPYTVGSLYALYRGDTIRFKGNTNGFGSGYNDYHNFVMSGRLSASGDITSLLNNIGGNVNVGGYYFENLFRDCSALTTAPELPATTLGNQCYSNMFRGCTSLTEAPELPATTLVQYCYQSMFQGCTSLTQSPELPALTLVSGCYSNMFQGCTSLTEAPELPATTLANQCYGSMFQGCTSLTEAPELPATTLQSWCYFGMFQGCNSLETAPELPATTLAEICYHSMFSGCTSLIEAPELPAETLVTGCYQSMFSGCTSLNYIKALFTTTPGNNYTYDWVKDVSPTGTFVKNSEASWSGYGNSMIPSGWTVQNYNPQPVVSGLVIYVDDFPDDLNYDPYPSYQDYLDAYVEDPEYFGANKYGYTGETFEYDGDEYYLWEMLDTEDVYGNTSWNASVAYMLTETIDYDTLNRNSMYYNTSNRYIVGTEYLTEDMEDYTSCDDRATLVRVFKDMTSIYVDEFPEDDPQWYDNLGRFNTMETYLDAYLDNLERGGANKYNITSETFSYDGDTYHVWEMDENFGNPSTDVQYAITDTTDFDTLYGRSIESDYENYTDKFIILLTEDMDVYREGDDALIKIEQN